MRQSLIKLPRFTGLIILTIVLLAFIAYLKPELIGGDLHKLSLNMLGALSGFWIDMRAFPYARPDGYLTAICWRTVEKREGAANFSIASGYEIVFAVCLLRRALMMVGGMLTTGMAL